jgi:hypothetical protein
MKILVSRVKSTENFTISDVYIDGVPYCKGLEDRHREIKVMHETRIPEGTYKVELRTFGGHHERYRRKFPDIHKGMLWVKDVPKFKDILIHIGNTTEDTSGCLLLGTKADFSKGILLNSTIAYKKFYSKVLSAIEAGDKVTITYETKKEEAGSPERPR